MSNDEYADRFVVAHLVKPGVLNCLRSHCEAARKNLDEGDADMARMDLTAMSDHLYADRGWIDYWPPPEPGDQRKADGLPPDPTAGWQTDPAVVRFTESLNEYAPEEVLDL